MLLIFIFPIIYARFIFKLDECTSRTQEEDCYEFCTTLNKGEYNVTYGMVSVLNGFVSFTYYNKSGQKQDLIYIPGGPSQSSQIANYLEIGPELINLDNNSTYKNNFTWLNFANLLFLDLPAGTGFGQYNSADKLNETQLVEQFYDALDRMRTHFLIHLQNVKLFTSDYGARVALQITAQTDRQAKISTHITTLGLLDPFISPEIVLREIPSYAFHLGLVDYQERSELEQRVISMLDLIVQQQQDTINWEIQAQRMANSIIEVICEQSGRMSPYHVLKSFNYGSREAQLEAVLTDTHIIEASSYFPNQFVSNLSPVFAALRGQILQPFDDNILKTVLARSVNVLVYQSQFDLIIPPSATLRFLTGIDYELSSYFYKTNMAILTIKNQLKGFIKLGGKLQYVMVIETGQLMHQDQPEVVYELVKSYVEQVV